MRASVCIRVLERKFSIVSVVILLSADTNGRVPHAHKRPVTPFFSADERRQSFGSVLGKVFEEEDERDGGEVCPPRKVFSDEQDHEHGDGEANLEVDFGLIARRSSSAGGEVNMCDISAVEWNGLDDSALLEVENADIEDSVHEVEAAVGDISIDSDNEEH